MKRRRMAPEGRLLFALERPTPFVLLFPPAVCFNPRGPMAQAVCRTDEPPLYDVAEHRQSACHFWKET
ncbi:methionine ABC transporter ATP-binding protein, partial [Streptomyces sp. BE308]|nr:methionine ABC transporter ATP-binding protein [Streptomyces sp. BE308]